MERRERGGKILSFWEGSSIQHWWTAEDNAALDQNEAESLSIKDTGLSCLKEQYKRELLVAFSAMSKEEKGEFVMELNEMAVKEESRRRRRTRKGRRKCLN